MLLRPAVPAAAKVAARRPWAGLPGSPIDAAAVDGRSMIVELIDPAFGRCYRDHRMTRCTKVTCVYPAPNICSEEVCSKEGGVYGRRLVGAQVRRLRERDSKEQTQWAGLKQLDGSQWLSRRCHDAEAQQSTATQCSCRKARVEGKAFGLVVVEMAHARHSVSVVQRLVFGSPMAVAQLVSSVVRRRPSLLLGSDMRGRHYVDWSQTALGLADAEADQPVSSQILKDGSATPAVNALWKTARQSCRWQFGSMEGSEYVGKGRYCPEIDAVVNEEVGPLLSVVKIQLGMVFGVSGSWAVRR